MSQPIWRALSAALVAVLLLTACNRNETVLTVHATATTRTAPDLAIVTLGVLAPGATARDAQAAQAQRMSAIMEAVRAAGVEDDAVQTVGYSIDPIYAYPRNSAPRITGYQSRNTITIRVPDVEKVSGIIDATVADGANELHGIQFGYQNEEGSLDAARAQAVEAARARAERYADAAGMRVARMLSITEPGGAAAPLPYDYARRAVDVSAEQSANAAISPGQLDNQSSVTVMFELR